MPPVGFEPTISAGERLQTHALDSADNVTGSYLVMFKTPNHVILRAMLPGLHNHFTIRGQNISAVTVTMIRPLGVQYCRA